jgi:hypothetical protein
MQENIFKKIIRSIDFFGVKPKFTIDNSNKYKTIIGGILSILIAILIFTGFFHFGRELVDKINPTVISSAFYQPNPDEYALNEDNFGFFIGIQNSNFEYYIDPTYVSLSMNYVIFTRKITNGEVEWNPTSRDLKPEPCQLGKHFPKFQKEFSGLPLSDLFCANPDEIKNVSLAGNWGEDNFNYISIQVTPCKNSTESDIICRTKDEIQTYLSGGFFVVNHVDTLFEPKVYENPRKYFRKNFYTTMSNKYYKEITFNFKNVEYNTDQGFLMEDVKQEYFLQSDNIRELYDFRSDVSGTILDCVFRMSNQKDIYNRQYIKIQDVIAKVGGLVKALLLIVQIAYSNFSKVGYYFFLGENLFEMSDSENKDANLNVPNSLYIYRNKLNQSSVSNPIIDISKSQKLNLALTDKRIDKKHTSFYECFRLGLCLCFINRNNKNKNILYSKLANYIEDKSDFKRLLSSQEKFEITKQILFSADQRVIFDYYTNKIDLSKSYIHSHGIDNQSVMRSYEAINSVRQNKIGERLKVMFEKKLA